LPFEDKEGCLNIDFASQSLYLWALWGFFFTCWWGNGGIFRYSSWKNFIWCYFGLEMVIKYVSSIFATVYFKLGVSRVRSYF
jgi:hypothetical protein